MGRPPGTTVFVGNISYDTTEDQLKEVFSEVGNVVSFRLMYDHETGRAKGFGFCEYEDKETAMSARRNLNGTQLNGRPLRVDLTDSDKQAAVANGLALPPTSTPSTKSNTGSNKAPAHPALPAPLATANPSMAAMSLPDIHATMLHLKKAVVQNPNDLRELLLANPRLAHAILQGQIMLGMVPPPMPPPQAPGPGQPMPGQPMQPGPRAAPQRPPPQRPPPQRPPPPVPTPLAPGPPMPSGTPQQPQMPGQMPRPGVPPGQPVPPVGGPPGGMMGPGMPPRQPMHMGSGLPRMPTQQPPQQQQAVMDEQAAILRRVMAMSQQEIDALQPEHRDYVLQLKDIVNMQNAQGMQPGMTPGMIPGMQPGPQQPPPPGPGQYR